MNGGQRHTMVYKTIEILSKMYPVTGLCTIAEVSRSGYYKWLRRSPEKSRKNQEDERILAWLRTGYEAVKGIYGYLRMKAWLEREHNCRVNHKRVYRLLKIKGSGSAIKNTEKEAFLSTYL